GQHVRDGLDPPMRMPRKAGEVVIRPVIAEIVEQQEGVELAGVTEAEAAAELHPGPLEGGLRGDHPADGADRHGGLLQDAGPARGRHPSQNRLSTRITAPWASMASGESCRVPS